jgi:hypothetical protein
VVSWFDFDFDFDFDFEFDFQCLYLAMSIAPQRVVALNFYSSLFHADSGDQVLQYNSLIDIVYNHWLGTYYSNLVRKRN